MSGWNIKAATAPNNVPISNAMSGAVFFTIKKITTIGTKNNQGLTLIDSCTAARIKCVSAVPEVSIFSPIITKIISVTINVGTVV